MTADFDFSVEIVRTNRKRSASIQLDGDTVKLTMPRNLSDRWAQNLIFEIMFSDYQKNQASQNASE